MNFDTKEENVVLPNRKIKINHIRDLFSDISINPVMGKYKIFYIRYPENMNINAQNALLKILEEPPKYVMIILAGRSIDNLLPTIKSRCTKMYIFEKENNLCGNIVEDFGGKENPFNLFYKEILELDKYRFYQKYKNEFTRANYKENIEFIEEALKCFYNVNENYAKLYEVFLETNIRIERNCNFEMLTDYFLFESWNIVNRR